MASAHTAPAGAAVIDVHLQVDLAAVTDLVVAIVPRRVAGTDGAPPLRAGAGRVGRRAPHPTAAAMQRIPGGVGAGALAALLARAAARVVRAAGQAHRGVAEEMAVGAGRAVRVVEARHALSIGIAVRRGGGAAGRAGHGQVTAHRQVGMRDGAVGDAATGGAMEAGTAGRVALEGRLHGVGAAARDGEREWDQQARHEQSKAITHGAIVRPPSADGQLAAGVRC